MQTMQKLMRVLVLIGLVSLVASSAWAQINVTFDENGNINSNIPGFVGPDGGPGGGIALLYDIANLNLFSPTPGDILVVEPDGTHSDYVRFNPQQQIAVYSDTNAADNDKDLADTGFVPTAFYPSVIVLNEVGPEGGPNGISWTPTLPTDPGFIPSFPGQVTYNFISDVPEPSTLVLLGMSAIGLLLYAWRRR